MWYFPAATDHCQRKLEVIHRWIYILRRVPRIIFPTRSGVDIFELPFLRENPR